MVSSGSSDGQLGVGGASSCDWLRTLCEPRKEKLLSGPGIVAIGALAAVGVLLAAGTAPRDPATLVIGIGTDPGSLDPARVTGVPEGRVLRALFEGLTVADPETLEPLPGAALRWEVSEDQLRYRFDLRADLRWSNGEPLGADDFRFAWLRLLDPAEGCPYASLLWPVRGARAFSEGEGARDDVAIAAPDRSTFVIELERPTPHFLSLTSYYPLSPVHPRSVADSGGSALLSPKVLVSNGPYRLERRWLRDRVRVERNPCYWDASTVVIPRIDYLAAESPTTLLNLFLTGEADWVTRIPRDVIPTLASDPRFNSVYRPQPNFETAFYRVNVTRPPLDDPRIRRALSLALDRAELCDRVTRAGEQPAWSFVPWPRAALERLAGTSPAATPPLADYQRACFSAAGVIAESEVPPGAWDTLGYDPQGARTLLAEAGYRVPGGDDPGAPALPPIEIVYNTSPLHQRVAEWIQDAWHRELGIDVRMRNLEWKSALDAQRALDYDVSRSSWIGDYLDPTAFLEVFATGSGTSRTGWSDPEFDRLLADASGIPDGEIRRTLLFEAERILLERGPLIPLWYGVTTSLVSPRIEGMGRNALDQQWPKRLRLRETEE